uniref:probable G-protein coupled receptor 139 n=1 Tax=Pristiophorus japonicus TaxID=55135 RepID=UPI00398EA02D
MEERVLALVGKHTRTATEASVDPEVTPPNLVAIVILSRGKCGLTKGVTLYLVAMAVADLLVIIFYFILGHLNTFYLHIVFLIYSPGCKITEVIGYVAIDSSVWLNIAFTFDRMVAICCQKLKTKYCTEKSAAIVITTVSLLSLLINIPWYFKYVPNGCNLTYEYLSSPVWKAYDWGDRVLTPLLPFVLILLLNTVTVRHILLASAVRRKLRAQRNGEEQHDPEMKNRRRSIILLFTISGSFILLWTTNVVVLAIRQITGMYDFWSTPFFVADLMGTMLQLLSSCTNTFIYAVTQSKFREEMRNTLKYPFTAILNFIK